MHTYRVLLRWSGLDGHQKVRNGTIVGLRPGNRPAEAVKAVQEQLIKEKLVRGITINSIRTLSARYEPD